MARSVQEFFFTRKHLPDQRKWHFRARLNWIFSVCLHHTPPPTYRLNVALIRFQIFLFGQNMIGARPPCPQWHRLCFCLPACPPVGLPVHLPTYVHAYLHAHSLYEGQSVLPLVNSPLTKSPLQIHTTQSRALKSFPLTKSPTDQQSRPLKKLPLQFP